MKILSKPEYLGQYGHINKLIVKRNGTYNSSSNAAYVTFSNELEAALAIIVCNVTMIREQMNSN